MPVIEARAGAPGHDDPVRRRPEVPSSSAPRGVWSRAARILDSRLAAGAIAFGGAIAVWQVAVLVWAPAPHILPRPWTVASTFVDQWDLLREHSLVTLKEVVLGFALACAVALPIAVLIVMSPLAERMVYPLIVVAQSVPKVALAPLMLIWFGFGMTMKVVVAAMVCFFPIVIDTMVGLNSVDKDMVRMARAMGAGRARIFRRIQWPSALPSVFAGLKTAVTLAVIGAVVAEFVGASAGLGWVILTANGLFRTDLLFAAIAALGILSVGLFYLVEAAERLAIPWHVAQRKQK